MIMFYMSKKDYRLDIKDTAKNGAKSILISLIFGILIIHIFGWRINNLIPDFKICNEWCPGQLEILLNYPIHYFAGYATWHFLIKILFKFFIKSEFMDKYKHELI